MRQFPSRLASFARSLNAVRRSRRPVALLVTGLLLPALVLLLAGNPPVWPVAGAQVVATATTAAGGPVLPRGTRDRTAAAGPGAVLAWGRNADGQLGDATNLGTSTAIAVQGLTGVTVLALGQAAQHGVAVRRDGTVVAWGKNQNGQLGDNTTTDRNVPVLVSGLPAADPVVAVAAGDGHSLALLASGGVRAWGANGAGQLGDGTNTQRLLAVPVRNSTNTADLTGIVAIGAGTSHSLAVAGNGTIFAWGSNGNSQLGDNTTTNRSLPVVAVGTGTGGLSNLGNCAAAGADCAVSAGLGHSLARAADGRVFGWGFNGNGQVGDNTNVQRSVPVAAVPVSGTGALVVRSITAGTSHSLAVAPDGSVLGWGNNSAGQLGDGTATNRLRPVTVTSAVGPAPLAGIAALAAGGSHSLALTTGGTVLAWGGNSLRQVGDGTTTDRNRAVPVLNVAGITAVAAGNFHNLALGPDFPLATATPQSTATPAPTATPFGLPAASAGVLFLVSPVRVLDTRGAPFGPLGFDGAGTPIAAAPFGEGDTRTFRVAGKTFPGGAVPAGAKGVTFTLTAVQAGPSGGFLTVFPGSAPAPNASTLNPSGATGVTAVGGNAALDAQGNLQIRSAGAARDVLLDVTGYFQ